MLIVLLNIFAMDDSSWESHSKSLKGVILDMCGVLYDSGEDGGVAISGSVNAVKRYSVEVNG